MSLISLLITLSLTFVGNTFCKAIATKKKNLLYSTTLLLGIAVLSYADDIKAFAAFDTNSIETNTLVATQNEQKTSENLRLTLDGNHYSGVERPRRNIEVIEVVNDNTIEKSIETYTTDRIIVSVADGSVSLSGQVQNLDVAQNVVEQVKAIPGVSEVTFNFSLDRETS